MRAPAVTDPVAILQQAAASGESILSEHQGFALCAGLGLRVPRRICLSRPDEAETLDLDVFPGDRVVLKIASDAIAHKTDVGGVRICSKRREEIERVAAEMADRFAGRAVEVVVHEFVEHDGARGGELLVGLRFTPDFGPVLTLGLGGVEAERLAVWEPMSLGSFGGFRERLAHALKNDGLAKYLSAPFRGRPARIESSVLGDLLLRLLELGTRLAPPLAEFEINPLVFIDDEPVALDVLVRLDSAPQEECSKRPLHKIKNLLEPRSIAIAGVSSRRNPGRIILENVIGEGFPRQQITVLKPGVTEVSGCRALPSVGALPGPVDLLILAVGAAAVPDLVEEVVKTRKAESVVLIPGGLGEHRGSEAHVDRVEAAIAESRATDWQGPVVNGGNCLGVRSRPGGYDSLFIPRHKLSFSDRDDSPLALISQSGAFAVARASKLWTLSPRYVISVGNQIDLTVGDYLTYLASDEGVRVFACYVEGFQRRDGARFVEAAERIVESGRPVVLYRAGRTAAGVEAAVSHTAAVAGGYSVTRQLASQAGVLVAETIDEFEDLTRALCVLEGRRVAGRRLGAMSNAGFESVAMADRLGRLQLAELAPATCLRLQELIAGHRLEAIVEVRNPLDSSPIFDDESFTAAARSILNDDNVDVGIVGCVPLTPALETLAADPAHSEDVDAADSVAGGLIRLWQETSKPWAVVIDAGPAYDRFADRLSTAGMLTFRSTDRALQILGRVCRWKLDRL